MLAANLGGFDLFDLAVHCVNEGKKDVSRSLIGDSREVAIKVIGSLSNDKYYQFANQLVMDFGLNLRDYPELRIIVMSRNGLVDMHFTEPTSSKYVPLHVMEDLIEGDRRLLKKLFYALMRKNRSSNAIGVYDRHGMENWAG